MGIGTRIGRLRIWFGMTQEDLAEALGVSRQAVSKWEMEQTTPDTEKVILMSRIFSVSTDALLLEQEELQKNQPQQLHLGSVYLIVRDFEKSISFYEKLLSMTVSNRNCGNRFAEFYFDNKCLALMNEETLVGHHYPQGDGKFVLNFWVEDLQREHERLCCLYPEHVTSIRRVHAGYHYFHLFDPDNNTIEITGALSDPGIAEPDPLSAL